MNFFSLFGVFAGLVVMLLKPKRSAVLGGVLIMIGQLLTIALVEYDHSNIKNNSELLLLIVCISSGQGSILVILACLESLLNSQTIQSSAVICTCIFAYYLGADSFLDAIHLNLLPDTGFKLYVTVLASLAFLSATCNGLIISDEEDAGGFLGKQEALSKGLIFKKVNMLNIFILIVYTVCVVLLESVYDMKNPLLAWAILLLVVANLLVPLGVVAWINPDNLKDMIDEPSQTERDLANKGKDKTLSEVATRADFYFVCFMTFTVIGGARMLEEQADILALGNDTKSE